MRVSVVIPAFNAEEFIGDAIQSALAQSTKVSEIIVVDDGSHDKTCEAVTSFGRRVFLIRQTNQGVASARNRGIFQATGEYVAFLDSDDFWAEDHIQSLLEALSNNGAAALAYSGKRWVNKKGKALLGLPVQTVFPSGWIFSLLLENNYISSSSCVMAKRDVLVHKGGFKTSEMLGVGEDYELWLRIAANHEVVSSTKPTVQYRRHEGNLTLNRIKYSMGHLEAVRCGAKLLAKGGVDAQNKPESIDLHKRVQDAYQEAIISTFWCCDYRATRAIFLQALSEGILDFEIALRGILSLFPRQLINSMKALKTRIHKIEQISSTY